MAVCIAPVVFDAISTKVFSATPLRRQPATINGWARGCRPVVVCSSGAVDLARLHAPAATASTQIAAAVLMSREWLMKFLLARRIAELSPASAGWGGLRGCANSKLARQFCALLPSAANYGTGAASREGLAPQRLTAPVSMPAHALLPPGERVTFDARRSIMSLLNRLRTFVRQDEGQDLLEYALLVALIALVAVAAVAAAGGSVQAIFNNIAGQLAKAA